MKNIQNLFIVLLFLTLVLPPIGSSQNQSADEFSFEVNRVLPYVSISNEKLNKAQNLMDINRNYKSSWVKEFKSVEILASHNGEIKRAVNKNDNLSKEQKDLIKMADPGSQISAIIKYIPDNTLAHNDIHEFDFKFWVDPDSEAKYIGGQQQLDQYLKKNAIDKIPKGSFKNYELTAIKFTIDEEGQVTNAHIFESAYQTYHNEKIDNLLLQTIRKMPCWKPAEYTNGTKVKQDFVLTVGNMNSCIVPLLSIRQLPAE